MAINLKFDLMGNPEPPSIVLANRNGNKLGQLDVDAKSIDVKDLLKTSEFSFTLNKYVNGKLTPHWDKVVDFKLVYCPEWDLWYEIIVELDEATKTIKTVFCTQLGQAELSQIKVYNTEINTEADIARDDYKISILYDEDNKDASIFHRVMSKAPHYSIAYIDESLKRIQRSFSFDDTSICDAFDEIEEEVGCLVVYNSNSDKNGMPKRDISIYDLLQNCKNPSCKHRGEFTDKCPKCGGTDIDYGYGEDTTIFVTSDELATQGISLVTDIDSVKNCFKLEAGDDLMTATIRNCNPNGSDYIWYFSNAVKEDMSKELVEAIEGYDSKYKEYYNEHISNLDTNSVNGYNALVEKYDDYYNTKSTCINCKYEGYFENECPSCHSKNILTGKRLQTINAAITGYPDLMTAYYNTIDLSLYLKSGLMPSVEMSDTNAEAQLNLLTASALSPVAVNVENISSVSLATANSAVLSMAKVIVRPTYKVEIKSSTLSDNKVWSGQFIVTNYSDDTDTATSSNAVIVVINNNTEEFIKQKIEKTLNKENTDDLSISGLFNEEKYSYTDFCDELKKYALNPLKSFYESCDACLGILVEQGAGYEDKKSDLYKVLYEPYYNKSLAIAEEIALRENEIAVIEGLWDKSDENNPRCITKGLQQYIEDCQQEIQDELNFESHLGEDLWLELCAYRREDKYSNSNYVSDGLNNAELFAKANEFIEVAEEEIFKSAELQHSISTTLNNLLSSPKFKPLIKYFKTGNWIRVQIDDKVYKLRLIEYNFNFGDVESIPVEFSDLTKIKNGTTDVQDVFSQAASMASSYDAIQRQAKKGDVARNTIDQWIINGLDSADVQIKSNDSEEILLTKNGLLARSYNDITGTYLPEQFKLTHNIMAYTTDNWETVSSALGKHNYQKWDGSQWITDTDYGLSSKFVTAGYITGSQFIGGEIISSNYNLKDDPKGTYINLITGDFEFAGGKITYDAEENNVILKGVTIQWDKVNKPTITIENIDGLSGVKEDIETIKEGLQSTTIDGDYVISPHIVGGDLKIAKEDGTTSAEITSEGVLKATGANITGDITATSLALGSGVKISTENIDGIEDYAKLGEIDGVPDNVLTTDHVEISESTTQNGITTQTITIGDHTYENIISGDFVFTNIGLGEDTKDNSKTYTCIAKDGLLTAKNAVIYGTIYATSGEFTGDIVADSLTLRQQIQIGNETDGYHTWINPDGTLTTESANIDGEIRAAKGSIGGFTIEPTETEEGKSKPGGWLYSGESIGSDESIFLSATDMQGNADFFDETIDNWRLTVGNKFGVTSDGTAYMSDCEITGGSLRMGNVNDSYSAWISVDEGVLNANGVNISGAINSVSGTIGGWKITTDALYKKVYGVSSGMCSVQKAPSEGLKYTLKNNGTYAVSGLGTCKDADVIIPQEYDGISVTSIGNYAFYDCKNLTSVTIPNGIIDIGESAFNSCDNLTTAIISDSVTSIGWYIFSNCPSLKKVIIPDSVIRISENAFSNCENLTSVTIPNGVKFIDYAAFSNCENLTSVIIPNSVINIGWCAFENCTSLTSVYYEGGESDWNKISISDDNLYLTQATFYYHYDENKNNYPSLVNDGLTSNPRFFAGSSSDIPTSINDAKFLVLEDGSLYSSAAKIKGHIEADTGNFGGLNISDNSITCNESDLAFKLDEGIIKSNKLQLTGYLLTDAIMTQKISGRSENSPYLFLEGSTSDIDDISISVSSVVTDEGETNFWGSITNNGSVMVSIQATKPLTMERTFTIYAGYKDGNDTTFQSKAATIKVNTFTTSVVFPHLYSWSRTVSESGMSHTFNRVGSFSGASVSPSSFTQPSLSSVESIGSSASLVPLKTSLNLGTINNPWHSLYSENIFIEKGYIGDTYSNTGEIIASDANKKNTIQDIHDKYSILFDQLRPVTFKLNEGTSGRTHIGLIAQELKISADSLGIDTQNLAAYCSWIEEDGSESCGIRYEEFISLCIYEIQKLKKRVLELENKEKYLEVEKNE